jgi:hypothetical protein
MPVSTVLHTSQSHPDITKISKMEPISPLQRKSFNHKLSGSISLQDLNIYSPKTRSRYGMIVLVWRTPCFCIQYSDAEGGDANYLILQMRAQCVSVLETSVVYRCLY